MKYGRYDCNDDMGGMIHDFDMHTGKDGGFGLFTFEWVGIFGNSHFHG